MTDKRILVGQIGAAHGVRGEVRVKGFTQPPEAIADYGPLEAEDGSRTFVVDRFRDAGTVLVVKFRGIDDRTTVERFNGTRLFVDRAALPEPDDEETFYHADLIGLDAVDAAGRVYGTVVAVPDFGAGDLLEIRPAEGSTVYLPFTKATVPVVDVAGGKVVIDPPAGLFASEEAEEAPEGAPGADPSIRRRRPGRNRRGGAAGGEGGS